MKKQIIIGFYFFVFVANLQASELIEVNQSSLDQIKSMEYETYDSGYAEWQASDIELFLSEDENFSVGVWKAKAGQEVMDSPYPYNTWMLIKEGEIETVNSSGEKNIFRKDEGFMTPKGWTGTFSITKDLVIIYIYDGLGQTENDKLMDLNKVARNIYNNESIFKMLSTKEFSSGNKDQLRAKEALSFTNKDESFQIGLWEAEVGQVPAAWAYDEFMHVLKGRIKMTDSSVSTLVIGANVGVIVPTGWEGVFSVQESVVKIWVIYDNSN